MNEIEKRKYVIGDIHGCVNTFKKLINESLYIEKSDEIYILGDYVDRGPDSKGVIDYIFHLQENGYSVHCLKGNHEQMLLDATESKISNNIWSYNGSHTTLKSFNVDHISEIDTKYINFFRNLHSYFKLEKFVLVHAGLNFEIPNPFMDKHSMHWLRNEKVDISKINYRRIICGHTPVKLDQMRASLESDKIMLDGGCVYYNRLYGLGNLCALELNSMKLTTVENIDF